MCSLKEFGVRTLLCDLGAADPCVILRSLDPEDPRQAPVTLRVREVPVWLVGFSSDSRLLVTRSADEKLTLWHLGAVRSRRYRVPHCRADSSLIRRSPALSETCKQDLAPTGPSGTNLTFRTLITVLNFAEILECLGYHLCDFIH
jgi:hypothetical protein